MNKSPKILIIGFGSVLNYGGEAIVQGTCKILYEIWPNAKITIATQDIQSAQNVLKDFNNISIIQSHKRVTTYRLIMGVLRRLGMGQGSEVRTDLNIVNGHDIVLSVGGDNFVENAEGKISSLLEDLMLVGEKAKKQGALYCLWGASVGPFNDPNAFKNVAQNLQKADLIVVREDKALNYLQSMGIVDQVKLAADPAYMMEPEYSEYKIRSSVDEILIGINFSLLAMGHVFGEDHTDNEFFSLVNSIKNLITIRENIKLVFIPHVRSSHGGPQDDYLFLSKIKEHLNLKEEQAIIFPNNLGSRKTKYLMQQCDMVIAARMHCFVGSVSVGTPTIMIAYSDKGYGMSHYIYGNDDWTIGLEKLQSESFLAEKATSMLSNKEKLHSELLQKKVEWQNHSRKAGEALRKIYIEKQAKK